MPSTTQRPWRAPSFIEIPMNADQNERDEPNKKTQPLPQRTR
jgi:hypothetical protein